MLDYYLEARIKGVFPEEINQFRINAMKYVKLRKKSLFKCYRF